MCKRVVCWMVNGHGHFPKQGLQDKAVLQKWSVAERGWWLSEYQN